ncbi:Uncharacterized protein APZ42_018117 [Daphnia magna]|uniref:Uncharacterized protein n=1 Tax=Daphnia magna TaxID=35525 RepID=A0A164ZC13_9CRUS|nr:Uncharacterized protein APZ42_018117 [Daphnia magna]
MFWKSMPKHRSRMASSELRRPKSANPNRRLRTATHKVTDPRVRPEQPSANPDVQSSPDEFSNYVSESCPLSVWTNSDSSLLENIDDFHEPIGPQQQRSSGVSKQRRTPSPTSSPTFDSLMTFECIQKASALRVLAKTLDRQRDVLQQASVGSHGETTDSRKTTPPPRKLRPLGREYSGPF